MRLKGLDDFFGGAMSVIGPIYGFGAYSDLVVA